MKLKPIETKYAGHRFRSRLEARWAIYFDHVGMGWAYELEGFDLPSGKYLPDFKLDMGDGTFVWYEIKPHHDHRVDRRWIELSDMTDIGLTVLFGMARPNTPQLMLHIGEDIWYRTLVHDPEATQAALSARFEHGETPR